MRLSDGIAICRVKHASYNSTFDMGTIYNYENVCYNPSDSSGVNGFGGVRDMSVLCYNTVTSMPPPNRQAHHHHHLLMIGVAWEAG